MFCSHVLEHQRNIGVFLDKLFDIMRDGAILAISVPPLCSHWVTLSHPNWLNAGMLLYHLVMAGFDCREPRVLTYGYNTSVVLRKKSNRLARQSWAHHSEVLEFLPAELQHQNESFKGAIRSINWTPDLELEVHPLSGLPQRPAAPGEAPLAEELRRLISNRDSKKAAALLQDLDLTVDRGPEFDYLAGMALGAAGSFGRAIDLVKRAAEGGFDAFWCSNVLGQFEQRRDHKPAAAAYFVAALMLDPDRSELYRLAEGVAPGLDAQHLRDLVSRRNSPRRAKRYSIARRRCGGRVLSRKRPRITQLPSR